MTTHVSNRIADRLDRIEAEHGVRILYAVESGSRAWGFASPDSDYDVRFVYRREPDWYLSVFKRDDNSITLPIEDDLDFSGWDFRKALRLFARSNGAMLEWLHSPIVYREDPDIVPTWRALVPDVLNPRALAAHYIGLARQLWLGCLQGESVVVKKYLYVLRALLCAQWVVSRRVPPPVRFGRLLAEVRVHEAITQRIHSMRQLKSAFAETSETSADPLLNTWIAARLELLHLLNSDRRDRPAEPALIDTFFHEALANHSYCG